MIVEQILSDLRLAEGGPPPPIDPRSGDERVQALMAKWYPRHPVAKADQVDAGSVEALLAEYHSIRDPQKRNEFYELHRDVFCPKDRQSRSMAT